MENPGLQLDLRAVGVYQQKHSTQP